MSIDSLREGIQVVDHQWQYVYLNRAAAAHVQRRPEELVGRTMMECFSGAEHPQLFHAVERVLHGGGPEMLRDELVYPTGTRRWFDLLVEPVPEGACILSLDITERFRAEEELRHAQRMEAIGMLAGGVAHDFNNQLTAILGFADLLLEGPVTQRQRGDIQAIREAALRSASLTHQLLVFSRRQALTVAPTDINAVVERITRLLDRLLGADIRHEMHLQPQLPRIMGDAQQLENVLMNLAVNARDAMPHGGRLRIETAEVHLSEEDASQHPSMQSGHYAVLQVSDTGHGMDDATRARIFEPFFTTKETGRGTGLGLSMAYGIVTQMGGFIWVYSEPGQGSTFRLYFPVTDQTIDPQPPEPAAQAPEQAPAAILVVEDDPGVRGFVARTLAGHGHRVTTATTLQDARLQLEEMSGPPDLVIMDVVLPGSSLLELAELPTGSAPVLFMSGYPDVQIDPARFAHPAGVLTKPFTVSTLLQAVNDALSERS